jgi:predicted RNA-binding protein with PIN domain
MTLLVDGHNLIGQMPGIQLSDPDDEAQLVLFLRRYATAKRGRQVLVVFDHGVYGHPQQLNGYGVTCRFARSPQDADEQLLKLIQQASQPRNWTVVTSDRKVVEAATTRGMRVIASHVFAKELKKLEAAAKPQPPPLTEKHGNPRLSQKEIAEWLDFFGIDDDEDSQS